MITTWYLQSHRTWDRSRHSCIGSPSSPWGPSRRASLCRLTIRGTPDRSKLFGSHGQRPWLHDVVTVVAKATGLSRTTIGVGMWELRERTDLGIEDESCIWELPTRVRHPGGG